MPGPGWVAAVAAAGAAPCAGAAPRAVAPRPVPPPPLPLSSRSLPCAATASSAPAHAPSPPVLGTEADERRPSGRGTFACFTCYRGAPSAAHGWKRGRGAGVRAAPRMLPGPDSCGAGTRCPLTAGSYQAQRYGRESRAVSCRNPPPELRGQIILLYFNLVFRNP